MSKLKSIADLVRGARKADLPDLDTAAVMQELSKQKGTFDVLQNLDEYEEVANNLSKQLDSPPSVGEITAEIEKREAVAREVSRRNGVLLPEADFRLEHQTRDAQEFAQRLPQQLRDPRFAAVTIGQGRRSVQIEEKIAKSLDTHRQMNERILGSLRQNSRWSKNVDEWYGDSPYKDGLQFHVDRITDPTRPNSFVQFEEPREMGLHMGTNSAAEGVIFRGGPEMAMRIEQQIDDTLGMVAQELDISKARLDSMVAQALNRHYIKKFDKNVKDVNIWDEVQDVLTEFAGRIGAGNANVNKLIGDIQAMPTPNTTPLMFRGKNGLLLEDTGGFQTKAVARQLEQIFPEDVDEILAAAGQRDPAGAQALQQYIESKGYDHIVYHNTVEDKGSLSIINWNPDLQKSPWDPELVRGNPQAAANMATQYVMSFLGIGGAGAAVQQDE